MRFGLPIKKTHTEQLPDIGAVTYVYQPRTRRLRITILPDKSVRVSVPRLVSLDMARQVVMSRKAWIEKQFQKIRNIEFTHEQLRAVMPAPDKRVAKDLLIKRIHELALQHGFTFGRIYIRAQRTRWGSCSHHNNINLNIKLAQLPQVLCDYVIIHELVHTRIKNHRQEFWQTLTQYIPDARVLDKQLRQYRIALL
jgi:predicted metal-dependent hydrolase